MTWAEFQIKSFAYRRMQENRKREIRELSFWAGFGYHKFSRPEQMYTIGDEVNKRKASPEKREAFKDEYKQYIIERDAELARRAKQN